MNIPKHNEIRYSALLLLQSGKIMRSKDFVMPLKEYYRLSEKDVSRMYDSGNGPIFYDRITWALSFLNANGFVEKPRRGVYQINSSGLSIMQRPDAWDYLYCAKRKRNTIPEKQHDMETVVDTDQTPQELLSASFDEIKQSIYDDILETIIRKTPRNFEHLVVKLLECMGYGGQVKGAGQVTQGSHDGGIDGILKEDILGLGRIHIQAKRYDIYNTVGREEIQKFVGALAVAQSNKGIFITTSSYSKAAIEYANNLNGTTTLVLIDGQQLAKYIYDYNLGMQIEQIIEIKKMNNDYWDTMHDVRLHA